MNFTHKCHFHPEYNITKFCPLQACTLPLCQVCESIHLQEHKVNFQDVKLMRFNQAYSNAIKQIQDFVQQERREYIQLERAIENDREAVLKFIGNYYSLAFKMIEEARNKMPPLEEKLVKLNKGSIKTLIFYYSGDIKLQREAVNFEPLMQKLKQTQPLTQKGAYQRQNSKTKLQKQRQPQKKEYSNTKYNRYGNEDVQNPAKAIVNDTNAFEGVQQPKIQQKQRQKNRKSIFDNTKKSTIMEPEVKEKVTKYSYNIQNQEEANLVKTSPTFKYLPKFNPDAEEFADKKELNYKIQRKEEPIQSKLRFQNQMMNKFTGAEQYQAYKKQRQQKLFQQLSYHNNKSVEDKPIYQHKILKPSDLDITPTISSNTEKVHQKYNEVRQNFGQRNTGEQGLVPTERTRSMSQANIVNREASKENVGYDLKKQVLPPQQIRKMLEKRIQERNRILSIKKGEIPGPTQELNNRKNWGQTKDSIINQVYQARY